MDLRGIAALTDGEHPRRVVGWLNQRLDALGEPVERRGGEVSKLLGGGSLAVFSAAEADTMPSPACVRSFAVAREALARNDVLNAARGAGGEPALSVDIVHHHCAVVASNIGAGRRLDLGVSPRGTTSSISGVVKLGLGPLRRRLLARAPGPDALGRSSDCSIQQAQESVTCDVAPTVRPFDRGQIDWT